MVIMMFLEFSYYSKALNKRVGVNVLLPEDNKMENTVGLGDIKGYKTAGFVQKICIGRIFHQLPLTKLLLFIEISIILFIKCCFRRKI